MVRVSIDAKKLYEFLDIMMYMSKHSADEKIKLAKVDKDLIWFVICSMKNAILNQLENIKPFLSVIETIGRNLGEITYAESSKESTN